MHKDCVQIFQRVKIAFSYGTIDTANCKTRHVKMKNIYKSTLKDGNMDILGDWMIDSP